MKTFLVQPFLSSLRSPKWGRWVKNWEFGFDFFYHYLSLFLWWYKFLSLFTKYHQLLWDISANVQKKIGIIATHYFTNFTLYTDFSVLICRGKKKKTRLNLSSTQDTTVFFRSIENRYQMYQSVNTGKWYSILFRKLDWIWVLLLALICFYD